MYEININNDKKRILIIDDDEDLVLSHREILQDEGYSVDIANNGRVGIRMQSHNPYNLIITDILMPGLKKTTKMVQEISAASSEQTNGANQINGTIQQMNTITQQNASVSEKRSSNASQLDLEEKN